MTRTVFPSSIHPDVLIHEGVTYVALPLAGGLSVVHGLTWMGPVGDWPRLFAHASGVLCAYKTSDDNCLTVANITTGDITRTGIPAFWNSPICWRDDGLLCVQATETLEVWSAFWPEIPTPPSIRQGVGTGLAQWLDGSLRTWDELGVTTQPVYLGRAIEVFQAPQGGIYVALPDASGILAIGTDTSNPRPAVAADGSLSIVHWVQGSHGSLETILYEGVTSADLVPPPVTYPVVPLTAPAIFGVYQHFEWPTYANAWVEDAEGAYPYAGIVGDAHSSQRVHWNIFDLEHQIGNTLSPCLYVGSPENILDNVHNIVNNPYDVLAPWCYPEKDETPEAFRNKARSVIMNTQAKYPGMALCPIWRVDTRVSGPTWTPLLTEDQVLHCLSIASEFGLPALFFQGDRAGFVEAAIPMLETWRNDQPCSVPVTPVPPPPSSESTAAIFTLHR